MKGICCLNFQSITLLAPFKWIWEAKVAKEKKKILSIWLIFKDRLDSSIKLAEKINYKIEGGNYNCVFDYLASILY
jgi:hypothetical protein